MHSCDVVICGAGISGLLLASELSKSFSVVVLEKNTRAQCSNKFWLTSDACLASSSPLRACVDSVWDTMAFIANNRQTFTAHGRYLLWDTNALESFLVDSITRNGSRILYGHRFYAYGYSSESIIAHANNEAFCAKIIVDCMGYSSPIAHSTNSTSILGYYHLFGRTMRLAKDIKPVAADNVLLSGRPSFLEVFPRSNGDAHVVLIASAKNVNSLSQLESDFNFIVERSHYSEFFADPNSGSRLHGIVPIGKVRKTSLDRIIFFGEAAQVHPAASCTALSKMLAQYEAVASSLASSIRSSRVTARDLKNVTVYMSSFAQRFHINMFIEMSRWTSDQGEAFVELLRCIDQKSLDDLIFGEITPTHFMQIGNLVKIVKKRNTLWVRPLLRALIAP